MNFELRYKEDTSAQHAGFWVAFQTVSGNWRVMGTTPHPGWISDAEAATWDTLIVDTGTTV